MVSIDAIAVGVLWVLRFLMVGLHVTALHGVASGIGPVMLNSVGHLMWGKMRCFVLAAIPVYVLMGKILVTSRIACIAR